MKTNSEISLPVQRYICKPKLLLQQCKVLRRPNIYNMATKSQVFTDTNREFV